ncbi:MAG: hypothetical protein AUK47_07815 [Deltaproteobacteria bacterium CG2_30_63_29]|nr:MAG: hypothetical protein AUK47_07815 [Deltaproteobacteria bacterium CG2_30_63_29]
MSSTRQDSPNTDIAIIGMGCVFADAHDVASFWGNILAGRECFHEIPKDRWDNELIYSDTSRDVDKSYVRVGGFIDDVQSFAAMHFGIAPRRVQVMDPQHRLLLDVVRMALQDAGLENLDYEHGTIDPDAHFDPATMGTFLGVSSSEHRDILSARSMAVEMAAGRLGQKPDPQGARAILDSVENVSPISAFAMPGTLLNMTAANVANLWGLRGPAYTIDAACASAAIAINDAVLYLRNGLCESALAGGVYLNLSSVNLISFSRIGAISKQGRCRPFDAAADGFLQGDGAGIVVLKRLDAALRDGDRIRAVIKGVGTNNDGNDSPGPMAPSQKGQLEAVEKALKDAGVDPATVGFVECHGTATPVGDPVEVSALRQALGDKNPGDVYISSVKANIGHTMSAAGVAGLIKAVLVLENKTIPPQAAFDTLHPKLELEDSRFKVSRKAQPWTSDGPRRAGVSSFGFGGTNCHFVLEEAPALAAPAVTLEPGRSELFVLTGPSRELLAEHAETVAGALRDSQSRLSDLAFSLTATRNFEKFRVAVAGSSHAEVADALIRCATSLRGDGPLPAKLGPNVFLGEVGPRAEVPKAAFMFPGQGAQRVGLMRSLYDSLPSFHAHLDRLASAVDDLLERPLLSYLYPTDGASPEAETALQATELCQPAMAALGLAFHSFLSELGLQPTVTMGHSLGEFVAAGAAGLLSPEDAVRFVARRGRIMADLQLDDFGAMAAVMSDRTSIEAALGGLEGVVLANLNHPRQTVISGTTAGVNKAVELLKNASIAAKVLRVSHAFHSPLVEGVAGPLRAVVDTLEVHTPRCAVVSAITGAVYPSDGAAVRDMFVAHSTLPVDYIAALEGAVAAGCTLFVEVGAGKTLSSFSKGTLDASFHSFEMLSGSPDGELQLHRSLGQLVTLGVPLNFRALYRGQERHVVSLPATPLVTEKYWAVQDKAVKLRPNLEIAEEGSAPAPSASTSTPIGASDGLVALFREQTELLKTHAQIVERQNALLMGAAPLPTPQAQFLPASPTPSVAQSARVEAVALVAPTPDKKPAKADEIDVLGGVMEAVAVVSAFPRDSLSADQRLATDLGFDSLMFVELGTKIEAAFPTFTGGIPQSLLSESTTIGHLVDFLNGALSADAPAAASEEKRAKPLGTYVPVLVERARSIMPGAMAETGDVLLTADNRGVAEALANRLNADGTKVALVTFGGEHNGWTEDGLVTRGAWPQEPSRVAALFQSLAGKGLALSSVIHCAACVSTDTPQPALYTESIVLAQALAASLEAAAPVERRSFVNVSGMGGGLGLDTSAPGTAWQAGLVAFTKALAREWPQALVKAIDVDLDTDTDALAAQILAERGAADTDAEVALRGDSRRIVVLQRAAAAAAGSALSASSVVLVTGGSGGLGGKAALRLAERTKCGLILVGTRDAAADAELQQTLAAIKGAGSKVAYVRWDIREPAPAALAEARAAVGPVTAVIHAAGAIRDKRVAEKSLDDARFVLGVKFGLFNVLAALAGDPLQRVAIFSSWSGRFGNVAQTDYSAANELLNRWASTQAGLSAVSILWPPWEDSAMAKSIPGLVKRAMQDEGVPFLKDAEGLALFDTLLASGATGEHLVGAEMVVEGRSKRSRVRLSLATHPYLGDHRLKDSAVMPLASALDYIMAAALDTVKGEGPLAVDNLVLYKGVSVEDDAQTQIDIELQRKVWENGRAAETRVEIRGLDGQTSALAYKADVGIPSGEEPVQVAAGAKRLFAESALPLSLEEFYAQRTFHGPRLQGVQRIEELGDSYVIGWVKGSTPRDWIVNAVREQWAVDPLVIDSSFQLVAYWLWVQHGKVAFPVGLRRFVRYAPFGAGPVKCTVVQSPSEEGSFVGSIRYENADGKLLAAVYDVQAKVLDVAPAQARKEAPAASLAPAVQIDPKNYQISAFQEVKDLEQRIQMAELIGIKNPFFAVHSGTARDVSVVEGREMINFSSYNYLGFSGHPKVSAAAKAAIDQYGTSVSASRVASGERPLHTQLESKLSELLGTEAAVVFSAGHATNESVIGHMFGEGDLIIHDMLAHNSIMQGAIMSGARRRPFPHNDWRALDTLLTSLRGKFNRCLIAIEGVYSMDGDIPDLPRFLEVKEQHKCLLFVDEAHSIGVLGAHGAGIGEHFGVDRSRVDFWMGTLSKSFSSCGGYIAGSKSLVQYIKYTAPGFVFSAGISPANTGAALASVTLMMEEPQTVQRLRERSAFFLSQLKSRGIDTGLSAGSAVIPCIVGNSFKCLQLSEALAGRGVNVQPIVYPAVEDNAARLRFFISAAHSEAQLTQTAEILAEELAKLEIPLAAAR